MSNIELFMRAEELHKKRSQYATYYYGFMKLLFICLATIMCLTALNSRLIVSHAALVITVKGIFVALIVTAAADPIFKPCRSSTVIRELIETHDKRAVPYLLEVIAPERKMAYRRSTQKAALNELLRLLPEYTAEDAISSAIHLVGPLTRIVTPEEVSNLPPFHADLVLHCLRIVSYLSMQIFTTDKPKK